MTKQNDVWTELRETKEPVLLYGTGNGADKILYEFDRRNISAAGVFASDGFVRERYFHSMKVMSFAQAEEKFGSFVAVVAFASSRPEVLELIYSLEKNHTVYVPDVPVVSDIPCPPGEIFDSAFYEKNKENIFSARALFEDEKSVYIYENIIQYKLTGKLSYLRAAVSEPSDVWNSLIFPEKYKSYLDLGAFRGDSAQEFIRRGFSGEITAVEPDRRSFKKLEEYFFANRINAKLFNSAAWSHSETLTFSDRGSRSSSAFSGGGNQGGKLISVKADSPDNMLGGACVDYIKYDVEGAELQALRGSRGTIAKYKPDLCVSAYHRSEDIFLIPMLLASYEKSYKLYMRRFESVPAWDINVYAIGER